MADEIQLNEEKSIMNKIESLLFVAAESVSPRHIAQVLDMQPEKVLEYVQMLDEELKMNRGLRIQWQGKNVQLTTAPEYAKVVEEFLGLEATARLSRAALEALAIVAYKQPITRPGIDTIRGVNSDGVMKNLLSKGLVEEVGRQEGPGRPILYGTTPEFLQHFGLQSITELPPLDESELETEEENGILKD